MKTWTRVEYSGDRNDEVVLAKDGMVHAPVMDEDTTGMSIAV
jgi:hypothetical protein